MIINNNMLGQSTGLQTMLEGTQPQPETSEAYDLGLTRADAFMSAMQQDSYGYMLFNESSIDKDRFKPDPNWNKEEAKSQLKNIHPKLIDNMLEEAQSQEHLEAMMPEWERDSAKRRYHESIPWYEDIGYSALAELTNAPIYILGSMAAMASAPASAAVLGSTFAGRAVVSGLAGMSVEGLKDVTGKHDKDYIDYLSALIFDGAVGAAFGPKTLGYGDLAVKQAREDFGITQTVETAMKNAATEEERKLIAQEAFKKKTNEDLSMDGYEQLDALINKKGRGVKLWEAARQDLAYATGRSKSPSVQTFSEQMFPDPTLQNINKDSRDLQTLRDRLEQRMEGTIQTEFQPLVKEFSDKILKSFGFLGIRPSGSAEEVFGKLVGEVQKYKDMITRAGGEYELDELVSRAIKKNGYSQSDELSQLVKRGISSAEKVSVKYAKMLKESGNTRFQEGGIKPNKDFYHYTYDRQKITDLINSGVKERDIIKFFEGAISSYLAKGGKKISPENIEKAAYMFYKGVSESKVETSTSFKNMLDEALSSKELKSEDKEFFASLREELPKGKPEEEAGVAFRERSAIDYGYTGTLIGNNGRKIELSMMDLISGDYFSSMRKYYRRSSGTTALQQVKWKAKDKFVSDEQLLKQIEDNPELVALMKQLDESEGIRNAIRALGLNPDDIINGLKNLELPDEISKLIDLIGKSSDEANDIIKQIQELRTKLMKEAGFVQGKPKDSIEHYINVYKEMYKRKIPKEEQDEFLNARFEALKGEMVRIFGEKFGIRIADNARSIASKYNLAGKKLKADTDAEFKKRHPSHKLDRRTSSYKEIKDALKKKSQVDNIVELRKFDDIAEEIKVAKNTIAGEERTLSTNQDIRDFIQQSTDEMQAKVASGEMSEKNMTKELVRLEHIMKDMQGLPTAKDPDSFAHTAQRLMSSLNIFRLLGQTGFTMAAEGASIAVDSGMKNMLKTMPEFARIMKAYSTGKLDDPFLKELQEETGMLTEFLSSPRAYELSHDYSPNGWDGFKKKAQDTVDSMAEFTLMMGGIKPLSAMFRVAHAKGIFTKMKEVANGKKPSDTYIKMLNELGLSKESTEKVYGNILAYSDKNGKMMNFSDWDTETKNLFMDGVVRRSDTLIQQKRLGDTMAWVTGDHLLQSSALGKFLLELKTFSLVAYTKQLGRVVNRADLHTAMLVASWGAALSLSYMAKAHYNYAGNQEKLDRALEPDVMFASVAGQMPLASIIPEIINTAGSVTGLGTPFGHSRHSGVATDFMSILPSMDLINNIGKTLSEPIKGAIDGEIKPSDFAPFAKVTGVKNNMLTRPFAEHLLQD